MKIDLNMPSQAHSRPGAVHLSPLYTGQTLAHGNIDVVSNADDRGRNPRVLVQVVRVSTSDEADAAHASPHQRHPKGAADAH